MGEPSCVGVTASTGAVAEPSAAAAKYVPSRVITFWACPDWTASIALLQVARRKRFEPRTLRLEAKGRTLTFLICKIANRAEYFSLGYRSDCKARVDLQSTAK